eukprot:3595496-Pleurochrysis_carterae.AAC.1
MKKYGGKQVNGNGQTGRQVRNGHCMDAERSADSEKGQNVENKKKLPKRGESCVGTSTEEQST